jgi:hypothetical protein
METIPLKMMPHQTSVGAVASHGVVASIVAINGGSIVCKTATNTSTAHYGTCSLRHINNALRVRLNNRFPRRTGDAQSKFQP